MRAMLATFESSGTMLNTGKKNSVAEPSRAGMASVRGEGGGTDIFVGRQPILSSEQKIVAYELLFRGSARSASAQVLDGSQATSRLLVNTFSNFGIERVLGDKLGFINATADLLMSDAIAALPAERVVLEILEDVEPTPDLVKRCQGLKAMGYRIALDDFCYRPEFEPLLALTSYVKLDVRALTASQLDEHMRLLGNRKLQLLAEKVETRDEFRALKARGIDFYQGYYFARPETLSMKRLDPSVQHIMQLFNLTIGNAEPKIIEAGFRQDVALSYNLLRYINSVGFGLAHKIGTIKHALVLLGRVKLARWLSLLLFSMAKSENPAPQALFQAALARARLAELLGRSRLGDSHQDNLFMVGMFSLLDAILDTPLHDSLQNLALPPPVQEALLAGSGPYAPYLELCRACEQPDFGRMAELAEKIGLTVEKISRAELDALVWAEEVVSAG